MKPFFSSLLFYSTLTAGWSFTASEHLSVLASLYEASMVEPALEVDAFPYASFSEQTSQALMKEVRDQFHASLDSTIGEKCPCQDRETMTAVHTFSLEDLKEAYFKDPYKLILLEKIIFDYYLLGDDEEAIRFSKKALARLEELREKDPHHPLLITSLSKLYFVCAGWLEL